MDLSLPIVLDYYTKLTHNYDNGNLHPPEVILPRVPEVSQECTTIPSPQEYLLPSVILWDPLQQLDCFANGIECPFDGHIDNEPHCFLEPKKSRRGDFWWQAGLRVSLMPRQLCSSSWPTVLLSRIYYCNSKIKHRTYIAHDPEILSKIPSSESHKIPFSLLHRTGFTKELGETVSSLVASGMTLVDIEQVIYQQHTNNFMQCKAKFEEDKDVCLQNSGLEVSEDGMVFPDYKPVGLPSMEMILGSLLDNFQEYKPYYNQRMSELSAAVLLMGYFFKSSQQMGTLGDDGKKWVPMYDYVFAVMNERGQVIAWQVTKGTTIRDVALLLENVNQRLIKQGTVIKLILMPECCNHKQFVTSIFGPNIEVKMDPSFAHQRLQKKLKIRKEDQDHATTCMQDFSLVFIKSTDLSPEHKEETPTSDIILDNYISFMSQWKMTKGETNERILHDPALRELESIKQSIIKGCISEVPPNSGAKYVIELRDFLKPVLHKRFLNAELALPAITVLFYCWNEKHGDGDGFLPINSYKAALDTAAFMPTTEKFGCVDIEVESENKENELCILPSTQQLFPSQLCQLLCDIDDECCLGNNESLLTANSQTLSSTMLSKVLVQAENSYLILQHLTCMYIEKVLPISIWQYHVLPSCTQLFSRSNCKVEEDNVKLQENIEMVGGTLVNLQDHDGFFTALSHSIQTMIASLETENSTDLTQVKEYLSSLGYDVEESKNGDESVLRQIVSCEWLQNKDKYSKLLVSPLLDFTQEAELFVHKGYYQAEMINLLPIAATRILRLPLIIFTSMEHFPVVPVMTAEKPLTSKCLYITYSAAGFGSYFPVTISPQPTDAQEKPKHVCRCGLGNSKNKHERQFCVQIEGKYLTRCECFRNGESCNYLCRCFHCSNPNGTSTEERASHMSQKTRLRTKHKLQLIKKKPIDVQCDETPKTSWSERECLTLTFLIDALQFSNGLTSITEIMPERLAEEYQNLQQCCEGSVVLRQKSLDDIKEHMNMASRNLNRFKTLYRRQIERHWGGDEPIHMDIADDNQLVVIVESTE